MSRPTLLKKFLCWVSIFVIAFYPAVSYAFAPPPVPIATSLSLNGVLTLRNAMQAVMLPVRLNPIGAAITGAIVLAEMAMWLNSNQGTASQVDSLVAGTPAETDKYRFPVTTSVPRPPPLPPGKLPAGPYYHLAGNHTYPDWASIFADVDNFDPRGMTYSRWMTCEEALEVVPGLVESACDYRVYGYPLIFDFIINSNGTHRYEMFYTFKQVTDNKYTFKKGSAGFIPDPADPDWDTPEGIQKKSSIPPGGAPVQITGVDENGVPNVLVVAPAPGPTPGIAVQAQYQTTDMQGNTQVVTQIATFAPGSVSSTAQTTTPGSINTNPSVGQDPVTNLSPNPVEITFPDDYAREETQQIVAFFLQSIGAGVDSIALNTADTATKLNTTNTRLNTLNTSVTGVKTAVNALHTDLTTPGTPNADPAPRANSDLKSAFFGSTFEALKGWELPTHSSECPTSSFAWNDRIYTFDAHCQLVNNHFNGFQAVMQVLFALGALFIVLRA